MRTTVTLDQDVYEAVQSLAASQRRSFGSVLSELARRGLVPRARTKKGPGGFPVISLPATSPPVTPEQVERALDGDS